MLGLTERFRGQRIFLPILFTYVRFGEALRSVQDELDSKNFYAFNLSFDAPVSCPPCDK